MSKTWLLLQRRSSVLLFAALLPVVAAGQLAVGVERPASVPELETLTRVLEIDAAATGENVLVVWTETRTDRGTDLYATRLDRFGALRDPAGIPLTATPGIDESTPLVEALGTDFVVVWAAEGNTLAAKVNGNGAIIQGPVVLAPGKPEVLIPMERDLAIAISTQSGTTISLLRAELTLAELRELPRRTNIEMARLGTGLLVTYNELQFPSNQATIWELHLDNRARTVFSEAISEVGTFNPPPEVILRTIGNDVILAAASAGKLVIARIQPGGATTVLFTVNDSTPRMVHDIISRGGNDFDVLATVGGRSRILRFTGDLLASENQPVPGTAFDGAAVITTGRVYSIWNVEGSVVGRFAFAAQQEFPLTISKTYASQQQPNLASDGSAALAVWSEDINETSDRIVARRLLLDGSSDTSSKLTLATRLSLPFSSAPVVTFTNGNYAVAWVDQRRGLDKPGSLVLELISPSGAPGSETVVSGSAHAESPAIANDLLVWTDKPITTAQVRAALVSNPSRDFEIPDTVGEPDVVFGNNAYLVVGDSATGSIRGTLVSTAGTIQRLAFDSQPASGDLDRDAAVAWNGRSHYLVVFERNSALFGRLLDANANPIGVAFPIFTGGIADNARVTWDGYGFIVSWTTRGSDDAFASGDVYAVRVLANGTVEQPVTIVSATDLNDDFSALLGIGFGRTLIAYQRMAGELQNVHRVYTRVLQSKPLTVKRRSVR